jgi:hypothetical protein
MGLSMCRGQHTDCHPRQRLAYSSESVPGSIILTVVAFWEVTFLTQRTLAIQEARGTGRFRLPQTSTERPRISIRCCCRMIFRRICAHLEFVVDHEVPRSGAESVMIGQFMVDFVENVPSRRRRWCPQFSGAWYRAEQRSAGTHGEGETRLFKNPSSTAQHTGVQ